MAPDYIFNNLVFVKAVFLRQPHIKILNNELHKLQIKLHEQL